MCRYFLSVKYLNFFVDIMYVYDFRDVGFRVFTTGKLSFSK